MEIVKFAFSIIGWFFSKSFSIPANGFHIFSATNISAKLEWSLTNKLFTI